MKQSERLFAATQPAFGSIGKMLVAIAAMQAILTITSFGQTAGDYRSAGTGNWSTLGTWERYSGSVWATPTSSEGYPGENSGTGNVSILASHTVTMDVSPANAIGTLDLSASGTSSLLSIGSYVVNVSGGATINGTSKSNGHSNKITVGSGQLNILGNLSVSGNCPGGNQRKGILEIGAGTVNVSSDLSATSSACTEIIFSGSGELQVGGAFIKGASSTFTTSSGCTVTYDGPGNQSIVALTYENLKTAGGGIKSLTAGGTAINSTFTVGSSTTVDVGGILPNMPGGSTLIINGTLDFTSSFGKIQSGTSGTTTLTMGSSGTIRTMDESGLGPITNGSLETQSGGSWDVSSISTNGTVEYYRSTTNVQTITDRDYNNLTITGSTQTKTWTLVADRTVNGNLTVNTGAPFTVSGTQTINLKGNWSNNGAFTAGTSTFNMNGTSAQTMSGSTFNNLTIDNSAGVTLLTDEIVNGTLTLTNGRLTLGAYNLTLGTSASISGSPSSSKMIVTNGAGKLIKEYSGTGSFTFPVGDNTGPNYSPATINVTSGSFSSAHIGVRVTDAAHPNIGSPTSYITRYWTVTSSGISSFSASCGFVYVDGDIVNSEGIDLGRYTSSWTLVGDVDAGTNTLSTVGDISTFGDFTGAEPSAVPVELTSFSGLYRNGRVTLSWKTATEVNNYGFEVQVSHEGEYWTTIGFVEGHGTVNTPQSYSFEDRITDHERSHGTLSYRLRQVDRDGSYTFSPVIMINVGTSPLQVSLFQNYPNPFNPETNIAFILPESQVVSLVVFNAYGREVRKLLDEQEMGAGQHVVPFQTQSLPSGAYVYKLITPEGTMHRVMTISK